MPDPSPAPRPGGAETPPPPAGPDRGLRKKQRLTRSRDFRETYDQGRRWVGRTMVLWLRSGEGASLRLGVVASRKVGNAVRRARAKRRLREVYRQHRHELTGDVDVVLVARAYLVEAKWEEVEREFMKLAGKARLRKNGVVE